MLSDRDAFLLDMRNQHNEFMRFYLERNLRIWRANYDVMSRLVAAGIRPSIDRFWLQHGNDFLVTQEQLPQLRKVFDVVRDSGKYKAESVQDETIRVQLDLGFSEDATITVSYVRKLEPGGRCQFVERTLKAAVVKELVCQTQKAG